MWRSSHFSFSLVDDMILPISFAAMILNLWFALSCYPWWSTAGDTTGHDVAGPAGMEVAETAAGMLHSRWNATKSRQDTAAELVMILVPF
jgi:hypothetical protein